MTWKVFSYVLCLGWSKWKIVMTLQFVIKVSVSLYHRNALALIKYLYIPLLLYFTNALKVNASM